MLIRLLPEEVSATWSVLGPMLGEGLPPGQLPDQKALTQMLLSVLAEESTVWAYQRGTPEGEFSTVALVMTTIYQAPVFNTRHLLVYSLSAFEDLKDAEWVHGFGTLRTYADSLNLDSIIAYTAHPGVVRMATRRLGASADYTLLEF